MSHGGIRNWGAILLAPVFVALLVFLASCGAGIIDPISQDDPQGYAGITHADLRMDPESGAVERVIFYSGKEIATAKLKATLPNGLVIEYDATGVAAFQAHDARAKLTAALGESGVAAVEAAFPGGIEGLLQALQGL